MINNREMPFIYVCLLCILGGLLYARVYDYFSTREPTRPLAPASVAAAVERVPALWTIEANFVGERADGILPQHHFLEVSMDNIGCPAAEDRRCCHAKVIFDGRADPVVGNGLCVELQADAITFAGAHRDRNVTVRLLDAFLEHRFERIYMIRFGSEPNDRQTRVTYLNDY